MQAHNTALHPTKNRYAVFGRVSWALGSESIRDSVIKNQNLGRFEALDFSKRRLSQAVKYLCASRQLATIGQDRKTEVLTDLETEIVE